METIDSGRCDWHSHLNQIGWSTFSSTSSMAAGSSTELPLQSTKTTLSNLLSTRMHYSYFSILTDYSRLSTSSSSKVTKYNNASSTHSSTSQGFYGHSLLTR